MLRDSVSAWSSHSPVCTITAVSKTLFGGRLVFHMILVSHLIARLGCLLATPARSAGSYSTSCGTPSMFVLRSMRKHPEILADVSVNHSRTGAVKLLITRRTSQSSKLLRVRSPDYSLSRRPQLAAISPLQKDDSTCASRTLLSSCLRGQCGHAVGTWTPGRADVARQPFRRSQLCTCAGQRYCAGH